MRSDEELGAEKPHGLRIRYLAGCRCLQCRLAHANYCKARLHARKRGDTNRIIDATAARHQLWKLARAGVGGRQVAAATSLPYSTVHAIKKGDAPRCREATARKILAVTAACRGDLALVPAPGAWRKIERLLEEGYTRGAVARLLGNREGKLQLGKEKITVRSRAKVDRIYLRLMT